MRVLKLTFLEVKNILCGKRLYLASAAIAVLLHLDVIHMIDKDSDAVSLLGFAGHMTWLGYFIMVIAILPFGYVYCDECNENYHRTVLSRCSPFDYSVSRVISSFFGGFLCVLIGHILWMIPVSLSYPFTARGGYAPGDDYLLANGKIFAWIVIKLLVTGMKSGFYVAVAVTVSSIAPNKYLIMAIPMMIYRIVIESTYFIITVPKWLDPYIQYMPSYIGMDAYYPFRMLYCAFYTLVCLLMFSAVFDSFMRRKI